jgi:hypothetical protein
MEIFEKSLSLVVIAAWQQLRPPIHVCRRDRENG